VNFDGKYSANATATGRNVTRYLRYLWWNLRPSASPDQLGLKRLKIEFNVGYPLMSDSLARDF